MFRKKKITDDRYTLKLLVMRFSAMGDVAMTVPVVKALALSRPDVLIYVASRPFAKAFYEGLAPNIVFLPIDLKATRYKGIAGLEHLYRDLTNLTPDVVADLHDVLRTKYVSMRFMLAGIPVSTIKKYRKERKLLTKGKINNITSVFARYADVFEDIGFILPSLFDSANTEPTLDMKGYEPQCDSSLLETVKNNSAIGIAPFAAHKGKIYPLEKMETVIALLRAEYPSYPILLFGAGKKEEEVFKSWCKKFTNVHYASRLCKSLRDEIFIMQHLSCLISMDSANMHLASLVNTTVVSVWGATHTGAGFLGWRQTYDDVVEADLPCRPCSIYGNKPCRLGDYPCLNNISPESIVEKVGKHLV